MIPCLFVSDLHGHTERYERLAAAIAEERPSAVFLGGDLLPSFGAAADFLEDVVAGTLERLRDQLREHYPEVFVILGNDDGQAPEEALLEMSARGLCTYLHGRRAILGAFTVFGYAYVPPTPFLLKDWERYDVSRYVDPGCVPPEEGRHSVPVSKRELRNATIAKDLERLVSDGDVARAVLLFHSPPYQTKLDRAGLDGQSIDHVPLDVHVGSIAIRRFIEQRQPWLTLHGHVHESPRLMGSWRDELGETVMLSAAHDGPELALVRFDLEQPQQATRELIQ
ncbi:MAG: metallophosphoesterase [Gemmatimonadales bacterium]